MSDALIVGDRMRMSVELIRDLQAHEPDRSIVVRVKEIRDEEDGAKVLVLERYREPDAPPS
jgi:hypothetical protein